MAARLMMHYPDKVTCDDNTFQLSRLPPHNFDVLITKRMKGLRNVGIIREFIESDTLIGGVNSVPYFQYPLLGIFHTARYHLCLSQVKSLLFIFSALTTVIEGRNNDKDCYWISLENVM